MEDGRITISRVSTNQAPEDYIKIDIGRPGSMVCQIEMILKDFAECLTGMGFSHCKMRTYNQKDSADKCLCHSDAVEECAGWHGDGTCIFA